MTGALAAFALVCASPLAASAAACSAHGSLTAAQASGAAAAGAAMAMAHGNYNVKSYLVYESPDPIRAAAKRPGVDAVVAETPYERLRYEGFMNAFQGIKMSPAELTSLRRASANQFGFVVYAHSKGEGETEQGFLKKIRPYVVLASGRRLYPVTNDAFGPTRAFYNVGVDSREQRWTGSLTMRFAAPAGTAGCESGTLVMNGAYGERYAYPFAMAKYR